MTDHLERTAESTLGKNTISAMAGDLLVAGTILADKYKIISLIGKGGMGSVYRVRQIFLEQDLALKVLSRSGKADDVHVRRFQNEGKAAFNLNHPNLVKVHDFGLLDDQSPYLVMDYVPGTTLADLLKQEKGLSIDQAVKIIAQTSLGLSYAHQQSVVHRDIKPSNIMLVEGVPMGEEGCVKIVDFGIAKVLNDENEMQTLTQTGEVFGSPFYMSPEQCSGTAIDHRTDIYSLGCVLFEALTGTPPHVGNSALRTMMLHQSQAAPPLKQASLGKEFPEALDAIVQKMLEKDPASRYQDLGIVANELADITRHGHTALPASSTKQSSGKGSKRILILLGLTTGVLAVAILLLTNNHKPMVVDTSRAQKQSAPVSPEQKIAEDIYIKAPEETIQKYSAEIKNARPFIPVAVQTGSNIQYKILFPQCGIGRISTDLTDLTERGSTRNVSCQAKGLKYFPTNGPYSFEADVRQVPWVYETPSVLKKFGAETLNELSLVHTSEFRDGVTSPLGELHEIGIEKMLKIATTWKNLKSLRLGNLPLTQQAVIEINNMPALESISLSDLKSMEVISQQPFIQRLKNVSLKEVEVNDFLKEISKSRKLEQLSLKNTDVLADSLLSLKKCPALNHIAIVEQNQLNDVRFAALTSLKQIRKISFGNSAVSAVQVNALERCNWLKEIRFSPASKYTVGQMTKDPRFVFADQ